MAGIGSAPELESQAAQNNQIRKITGKLADFVAVFSLFIFDKYKTMKMNIRCQPGSFQWPRLHWGQKSENFLGMVTSHPSPMGTPFYHVTTIALILTQPFLPTFFPLWIGWNLVGFSLWCVLNSWSPAIGLSVKYHLLRRSDFVAGFQRHIVFFLMPRSIFWPNNLL